MERSPTEHEPAIVGASTARIALAVLVALSALGALRGSRVTVTPAKAPPMLLTETGLSYESFHEAAAFWDLEAAARLATSAAERGWLDANRALMAGDEAAAEAALVGVRGADDPVLSGMATRLLEQLYFADGRWDRFAALGSEGAGDDPFRVLVETLGPGPMYRPVVPAEPFDVLTTPDAGLPTLRVSVNGRPFDFILDTGAPFAVINEDVAAAAGVVPVGERTAVIRNEVVGRPARIDRLELGAVVSEGHPVLVVPTDGMTIPQRPSDRKTIQGILGWPLIRALDLHIDLDGGVTTVRRPAPRAVDERNLFFCFRPVVVARDARGMPLHFMLDTGTDGTLFFARLGKKAPLGRVRRMTVGGARIGETTRQARGRVLDRFDLFVDGRRVELRTIPMLDGSAFDGMFGTDLHRHGTVRLDALNGRYELGD